VLAHPIYGKLSYNIDTTSGVNLLSKLTKLQCAFLLREDVARFVTKSCLSFEEATSQLEYILEERFGINLIKRLRNNETTIGELEKLTVEVTGKIDLHPFLNGWISCDLYSIVEMENQSLAQIHCDAYAKRLFNLYLRQPSLINTKLDTLANLLQEIASLTKAYGPHDLKDFIIKAFVLKLKQDFSMQSEGDYAASLELINDAELNEAHGKTDNNYYWQEVLDALILKSSNPTKKRAKSVNYSAATPIKDAYTANFFQPAPNPSRPSSPFYSSLKEFMPLCTNGYPGLRASSRFGTQG